jgi:hypothetical protein
MFGLTVERVPSSHSSNKFLWLVIELRIPNDISKNQWMLVGWDIKRIE